MGKIDHNKNSLLEALGVDENFMDDIRESFSSTMAHTITHMEEGTQDSKILYSIFKKLKQRRWDNNNKSEDDIEIEMYLAGYLLNTILERFKNSPPPGMDYFSTSTKHNLPPGIPPALAELINKIESIPGTKVVIGKGDDIPDEIKKLLNDNPTEQPEDELDTSMDDFFSETSTNTTDPIIPNDGEIDDIDALEESIKENLDKVSDAEIRYFVDVIRDCEEKCPLEKRMSCSIFKRYEEITNNDEDQE